MSDRNKLMIRLGFILCMIAVLYFAISDNPTYAKSNSNIWKVTIYANDGKVIREWNNCTGLLCQPTKWTFISENGQVALSTGSDCQIVGEYIK
jgi:hypothetical protein